VTIFVDTSGLLAIMDRDDPAHETTRAAFELGRHEPLATHAYAVVETLAVARRRFGPEVTARIIEEALPALQVAVVDRDLHDTALADFRAAIDSAVSLVDRTSFAYMRREGIVRAIALDPDFRTAGFETLPDLRAPMSAPTASADSPAQ
jgi:predicted nucleic acid-binding protein